jgi:hypothetical protein
MSIEELKVLSKEYYDMIKKEEDMISKIFLSTLKEEIFDKYPSVESVGWPQYTPYFNDGELCHFSVHSGEESIRVNGVILENLDEMQEYTGDAEEYFDAATFEKVCEIVSKILNSTPDSVLEELGESFIEVDRDLNVRCECINHD